MGPVAPKLYVRVFAALIILTVVTIVVSSIDLGPLNTFFALSIAAAKALLVILYFMHLRHSSRLTWLFAGAGFFMLAILIALTMGDTETRHWIPAPKW